MPEVITQIWEKIKTFWGELEKEHRIRIYISAGVFLVALITIMIFVTRVEYVPLFQQADDIDTKAIVEYLENNDIKYKKGSGQTILVSSKVKENIKFDLITQDIVSSDVKFEDTWSKISVTTTESDKQILFKDWKRKNLISQLKKFDKVISADVDFTEPEKSVWARVGENQQEGSAFVKIERKGELSPAQVEGVTKIAAAALGIPVENVTVVDQNFNILNRNSIDTSMDVASDQEEMLIMKANQLQNKVYQIYGTTEAVEYDFMKVVVNPVLDFDTLNKREKGYTAPEGSDGEGFELEKETKKTNLENGDASAVPGMESNPGTTSYQTGNATNSNFNEIHEIVEKGFNEFETESKKAIGTIIEQQSSMAIVLWYGDRVKDASGLTNEFLEKVRLDASNATGIPVNNISVSTHQKSPTEEPELTLTETVKTAIDAYGFFVLMLILIIGFAIAAIPRKKKEVMEEEMEPEFAGASFVVPDKDGPLPDIDLEEHNEIKKQIDNFVEQKPEAVAQLLRNWLTDEWD